MGVLGLWQILESVGHPIKVEGLEGKRLGVDANIWLYKFIRGFREKDNATSIESHKLGLFNRISKLLFYKIKPIFVFDGPAPALKRKTLDRRQNIRHKHLTKVQDAAMRALALQLKKQYPDAKIDDITIKLPEFKSNSLVAAQKLTNDDRDLFYLPPEIKTDNDADSDVSTSDIFETSKQNLVHNAVDIKSEDFGKLPPEIRYEILQDIKHTTKRRHLDLPDDASSFSNYQLEKIKARRLIQEKIEQCEKEICSNLYGDFRDMETVTTTDNVIESTTKEPTEIQNGAMESKQIAKLSTESNPQNTTIELSEYDSDSFELLEELTSNQDLHCTIELMSDESSETTDDADSDIIEIQTEHVHDTISLKSVESEELPADNVQEKSLPEEKIQHSPNDTPSPTIDQTGEMVAPGTVLHPSDDTVSPSNSPKEDMVLQRPIVDSLNDCTSASNNRIGQTLAQKPSTDSPDQTGSPSKVVTQVPGEEVLEEGMKEMSPELHEGHRNTCPITTSSVHLTKELDNLDQAIPSSSQQNVQQQQPVVHAEDPVSLTRQAPKSMHQEVTSRVIEEAKELLRLFGIPYIDAAGEAEAQCALLEKLKFTEGTITDDSDIWLFGAQNVFRYFFSDDKYVMQYKMTDIEYHLRLNRENLVCFAMLVGSDYTDGIMNVGPVTALEILSEFPGDGLESLMKFKEWRKVYKSTRDPEFKKLNSKKRAKFLNFHLPDEFPSKVVFEGYLRPVVDTSTETFSWGTPELDELREYARRNFAWDIKKIDEKLLPVMKKLSERKTQTTIDTFFFKTAASQNPEMFRSKRVNQALAKIANKREATKVDQPVEVVNLSETDDDDDDEHGDSRDRKPKVVAPKKTTIARKKTSEKASTSTKQTTSTQRQRKAKTTTTGRKRKS